MRFLKYLVVLALIAGAFAAGRVVRRAAHPSATVGRRVLYYVDAMHPWYTSDKPGIAPDCGMQLEPVYDDGAGAPRPAVGGAAQPPQGGIRISAERQQAIGVTFAPATYSDSARPLRTSGQVTYDETRTTHVHTRVEGWAEQVLVDFTGDVVKKGQTMLTLYSPDMLASQQELLLAARARDAMRANPDAAAAQQGESLFEASRRRLELWDLGADEIDRVLRTGQPIRNIVVRAPASGVVTARNVYPNQKITPDSDLYTIVDLSRVWIVADVPEANAAAIHTGQRATVSFASPGVAPLSATVAYIQPELDPVTRTLKVRLDVANPGQRLRPEMYVDVEFAVPGERRLTIPSDAILDTGEHQRVFVDVGDDILEPRDVTVGERLGDRVAILSGLAAGERVVASGTFLIDAETRLRAPAAAPKPPQHAGRTGGGQ